MSARKGRIRRRPVTFGNPALGTYSGSVYTVQHPGDYSSSDSDSDVSSDKDDNGSSEGGSVSDSGDEDENDTSSGMDPKCARLAAMVAVPPDQVPSGVLTFARSHRSSIEHVRIVIASDDKEQGKGEHERDDECGGGISSAAAVGSAAAVAAPLGSERRPSSPPPLLWHEVGGHEGGDKHGRSCRLSPPPSPTLGARRVRSSPTLAATPAEGAASILAFDEARAAADERRRRRRKMEEEEGGERLGLCHAGFGGKARGGGSIDGDCNYNSDDDEGSHSPERTYLVLFALSSPEAASSFVSNLHGRPYTSLMDDIVCHVHRVAAVEGDDGVSLLSPFFAPSGRPSAPMAVVGDERGSGVSGEGGSGGSPSGIRPAATPAVSAMRLPSNKPLGTAASSSGAATPVRAPSPCSLGVLHGGNHGGNARPPSPAEDEHKCPVCLEPMDLTPATCGGGNAAVVAAVSTGAAPRHSSSILTTVCNHTFHVDCLLRWEESPCPVCRYDHSGLNEALSQCHACGTTDNNYVCLICGVVSCGGDIGVGGRAQSDGGESVSASRGLYSSRGGGRWSNGNDCGEEEGGGGGGISANTAVAPLDGCHARAHYDATLHAYALDTQTQHVWDFAGQGYVHRLIQNVDDGKLVEVSDPNNTTSQERSLSPGLTDAQEGEVVHRKLEGFASQYYTLLKSQLEQQRIYYEGRLEEIRREHGLSPGGGLGGCRGYKKGVAKKGGGSETADLISALKQDRNQIEQRAVTLQRKYQKVTEDVVFLKSMNESLEANKGTMKMQISMAQREHAEAREMIQKCLPPLENKVKMLMLQLEGGNDEESFKTDSANEDDRKPTARRKK